MTFREKLSSFFNRKKKDVPLESLVVVLLPKKTFVDKSYKDERGLVIEAPGPYFDSCATDLQRALIDAYYPPTLSSGKDPYRSMEVESNQISEVIYTVEQKERSREYLFNLAGSKVTYSVSGVDGWQSDSERWSNDIMAVLSIQEPQMNIPRCKAALESLMKSHLLEYRPQTEAKFGIFYGPAGKSEESTEQGVSLLKKLQITPTEAAEFFCVMIYAGHRYKKFEKDEITQLGF